MPTDRNGGFGSPNHVPSRGGDEGANPPHRHEESKKQGGYEKPNRQPSWPTGGDPFSHKRSDGNTHGVF